MMMHMVMHMLRMMIMMMTMMMLIRTLFCVTNDFLADGAVFVDLCPNDCQVYSLPIPMIPITITEKMIGMKRLMVMMSRMALWDTKKGF